MFSVFLDGEGDELGKERNMIQGDLVTLQLYTSTVFVWTGNTVDAVMSSREVYFDRKSLFSVEKRQVQCFWDYPGSLKTGIQSLAVPQTSSMILSKSLSLSVPQFHFG